MGWAGGDGEARRTVVPALLIPGIVPFDEAFGALQLRVQTVLLAPVPGHALGGDAETEQNGHRFKCLNNSLQDWGARSFPQVSSAQPQVSFLMFCVSASMMGLACMERVSLFPWEFLPPSAPSDLRSPA